jgi:hypothetical protein
MAFLVLGLNMMVEVTRRLCHGHRSHDLTHDRQNKSSN